MIIELPQNNFQTYKIVLLDGRRININRELPFQLEDDIKKHYFDLSWIDTSIVWHNSVFSVIVAMLSTHSLSYVQTCLFYVNQLACALSKAQFSHSELGEHTLEVCSQQLKPSSWQFIRPVLNKICQSGMPGIDSNLQAFLRDPVPFEERGSGWYFALVANDPERGAFTEQELRSLRDGVDRAFEQGRLTLQEWALVWFLIATGVRPIQIARTRISDVIVTSGPEGTEITLAIPLAKGENQIVRDRWKRKAPSVLTEVLLRYLKSPFVADRGPDDALFADQSANVSATILSVFRRVETYSQRLRGPIPVFPYRFRYTLGTRAIALGASDHEAARLLTHRSTFCIQYYRAAMPMLQRPIQDAIGQEMSFLAQAFQGRLIGSLDEATRRGQAGALIRDFAHLVGQNLGACGTNAECHQHAPRACLSCRKFEPLMNAPWEQFLAVLRDDLSAETEERIRLITQEQIDAVHGIISERDAHHAEQTA
jgi:hypothetical protein